MRSMLRWRGGDHLTKVTHEPRFIVHIVQGRHIAVRGEGPEAREVLGLKWNGFLLEVEIKLLHQDPGRRDQEE